MRWKILNDKIEWSKHGNYTLRCVAWILDYFTQLFFGIEITVTSAIRPKSIGRLSYHPKGQALDFKTKNIPEKVIKLWVSVIWFINLTRKGFKDFKGKFTWVHEYIEEGDMDESRKHFHLQYKKGEPV